MRRNNPPTPIMSTLCDYIIPREEKEGGKLRDYIHHIVAILILRANPAIDYVYHYMKELEVL